jgi:uncharacterized protein (TIGR02118 family)
MNGGEMIRVSVLYPGGDGKTFDISYYCEKHIPLVQRLLGAALKAVSVDFGISGGEGVAIAPYMAIGYLSFDSIETFRSSFGPVATQIQGDVPNYTNVRPVIQIGEVRI